jgi:hypothetical protein
MGLRCSTANHFNTLSCCTGIVLAGIFVDGSMAGNWNLFDCSFVSAGYLEMGNPLIVQANTYLFASSGTLATNVDPAGFFGFIGMQNPVVRVGSNRDVTLTGMVRHALVSARLTPQNSNGGNKEIGFRFVRWSQSTYSFDDVQLISVISESEIVLSNTNLLYSGVYFHDTYGATSFAKGYAFRAQYSELTVITSGVRIGDPSIGPISCAAVFLLFDSKWRMSGEYNFNDVVDCTQSVFLLKNSQILRDDSQGLSYGRLRFAQGAFSLMGSVSGACVEMDKRSLVHVAGIDIVNAFTVSPMPLVRGSGDSTLIVGVGIDLPVGGLDVGPDGAVVMTGGYAEYTNLSGGNSNPSAIFVKLDKGARGYHPAVGSNPNPGQLLYLGGAGAVPYPVATANDLAGPATSELCALSR